MNFGILSIINLQFSVCNRNFTMVSKNWILVAGHSCVRNVVGVRWLFREDCTMVVPFSCRTVIAGLKDSTLWRLKCDTTILRTYELRDHNYFYLKKKKKEIVAKFRMLLLWLSFCTVFSDTWWTVLSGWAPTLLKLLNYPVKHISPEINKIQTVLKYKILRVRNNCFILVYVNDS